MPTRIPIPDRLDYLDGLKSAAKHLAEGDTKLSIVFAVYEGIEKT